MPPAARIGDQISHLATGLTPGLPTGTIGPPGGRALPPGIPSAPLLGVNSVLIAGKPAAVVGTVCVCDKPPQHAVHLLTNRIVPAVPPPLRRVLIGGHQAARRGDATTCRAVVSTGAPTVLIGG
ncbi:PAAR domain-containing protein [Micromonospora olivasterospora]|uniref:Putative Zn-binding protein involved in type VI secretion n=1 Tax=Micromonospora olivasterospora TaxID=1880 RepID=A0A562I3V5_MICOL|nr:PAAR domain-containing protein [Micromonospora olivasterospora]TWH65384.1 putative Zn-binding protein involved in type VI secretion [Micromonospora olivasterospora]